MGQDSVKTWQDAFFALAERFCENEEIVRFLCGRYGRTRDEFIKTMSESLNPEQRNNLTLQARVEISALVDAVNGGSSFHRERVLDPEAMRKMRSSLISERIAPRNPRREQAAVDKKWRPHDI